MAGLGYSVILKWRDLVILGLRKSQHFDVKVYLPQNKSQNPKISNQLWLLLIQRGILLAATHPEPKKDFSFVLPEESKLAQQKSNAKQDGLVAKNYYTQAQQQFP